MASLDEERTGAEVGITRSGDRPGSAARGSRTSGRRGAQRTGIARRTGWTYRRSAVLHPYNMVAVAIALLLGLVNLSGTMLLVGLIAELLFLTAVPRLGFVRGWLDAGLDDEERARARRVREALIAGMGELHRRELARIEGLVDRIREIATERPNGFSNGGHGGLDRLSSSYIRLAVAHRACEQALATTSPGALRDTIRSLETAEIGSNDRMREVIRRRLTIAYKRAECWQRTRESVEVSGHQLAAITDLVHLAYQESLAPADARGLCDDIDRLMLELDGVEGVAREIGELGLGDTDELIVRVS